MNKPMRLSPTACSPKLLVLEWVRQYFLDWGASPSLSEIAAGLSMSKVRIRDRLLALQADGELIYAAATKRGIVLVNPADMLSKTEILLRAKALGLPFDAHPVTNDDFEMPAGLDDIPSRNEVQGEDDGNGGDAGVGGASA